MRKFTAGAALVLLAACSSGEGNGNKETSTPDAIADASEANTSAATATTQPEAFAQCAVCHSTEAGKNGIGPTLAGVYGAKAGHVTDFTYSPAMRDSGLTWDDATLNAFLENPQKTVPGTQMTFTGMQDAAQRQQVIDYLKTLK